MGQHHVMPLMRVYRRNYKTIKPVVVDRMFRPSAYSCPSVTVMLSIWTSYAVGGLLI